MPTPSPWETIDLRYPFPGTTGFLASSIFSVPRAPMTSVFEGPGQPPPPAQNKAFPIKIRVIWVLGIYIFKFIPYMQKSNVYVHIFSFYLAVILRDISVQQLLMFHQTYKICVHHGLHDIIETVFILQVVGGFNPSRKHDPKTSPSIWVKNNFNHLVCRKIIRNRKIIPSINTWINKNLCTPMKISKR